MFNGLDHLAIAVAAGQSMRVLPPSGRRPAGLEMKRTGEFMLAARLGHGGTWRRARMFGRYFHEQPFEDLGLRQGTPTRPQSRVGRSKSRPRCLQVRIQREMHDPELGPLALAVPEGVLLVGAVVEKRYLLRRPRASRLAPSAWCLPWPGGVRQTDGSAIGKRPVAECARNATRSREISPICPDPADRSAGPKGFQFRNPVRVIAVGQFRYGDAHSPTWRHRHRMAGAKPFSPEIGEHFPHGG